MDVERKSPPAKQKNYIPYHEILNELFLGYHSHHIACHRELLQDIAVESIAEQNQLDLVERVGCRGGHEGPIPPGPCCPHADAAQHVKRSEDEMVGCRYCTDPTPPKSAAAELKSISSKKAETRKSTAAVRIVARPFTFCAIDFISFLKMVEGKGWSL
jgi:hypothetical protein